MTDNQLPILADGLFDGGLAADVAPKDLRAAVDVLRAAQQSGSVAELALMADKVHQFSAEVNSGAVAVGIHSSAQAATTTFLTQDITRSNTMFATRITRKAFTIVAITLLAAGTAAAAAGGALPMFVDDEPKVVVESADDGDVAVADDVNDDSTEDDSADDETNTPPAVDDAVENNNGDVDHHGKCTAWTNGAAKDATNPSFAELQVAADAAGVTIDEYCAAFDNKGNGNSGHGNSGHGNSGHGNSGHSDDEEDSDSGNGNSGNGNSGNGNSGNGNSGNGNSGNGNSGNGNSGNGNSGNGNSGSGHGNSGHDKADDASDD